MEVPEGGLPEEGLPEEGPATRRAARVVGGVDGLEVRRVVELALASSPSAIPPQSGLNGGEAVSKTTNDVELCAHLGGAWEWPMDEEGGERLEGSGNDGVVPDVEVLAKWMAENDDWLPGPNSEGADRKTDTTAQAETVWQQIPEGLRVWCARFEPNMFKTGEELLVEFEQLVDGVVRDLAAVRTDVADDNVGGDRAGRTAMPRTSCASADAGSAASSAPSSTARPTASPYASASFRHAVMRAMVAHGMRPQECLFVMEHGFGFDRGFGKVRYAWDADRSQLRWVLSLVDKFVTMMMGARRPTNLRWRPFVEILKSEDWRAGGVHEPAAVAAWAGLHGVSSWVMEWVKNKFYVEPTERVPASEHKNAKYIDPLHKEFDMAMFEFADKKLEKDEKLGVLTRLGPSCKPDNVNRIGMAPKNSEEEPWRVVGDMRPINKMYKNRKMKYETVRHVSAVLEPGDWGYVLDQTAAYHSCFVQERLARQFGIQWRGIYKKWKSLPFGFVLSPWCFSKMMRQVVKHWRALNRKILQFLDDALGGASDFVTAVMHRNEHIVLLHSLGFRCSAKSSPLPEQTKKFLGIIIHLAAEVPSYHIPTEKIAVLQRMMGEAVCDVEAWTMRKVAKIAGKLLSMSLAIPATRLMSRELYKCMHSNRTGDWDAHINSSAAALHELRWLIRCLAPWNHEGYPIWVDTKVSDFDITADASPTAGGFKVTASQSLKITQLSTVLFRPEESEMAQCHREFWILCLLVRGLARQLHGRRIRVRVDAVTTQHYWRNGGGRSSLLTNMTKLLWATCVRNRITIIDVMHIPGTLMVTEQVDALSRPVAPAFGTEADRDEWMLTRAAFNRIEEFFGVRFTVDRFASRVNRRCPRYNAKQWEPEAADPPSAFAHEWGKRGRRGADEYNFCHPPLRLIPHVMQHARRCKAWVCMVVPRWPSQPWWPGLASSMCMGMCHLGRTDDILCRLEHGRWQPVRRPPMELIAVVCDFRRLRGNE